MFPLSASGGVGTTITVDTSADLTSSTVTTCTYSQSVYQAAADGKCTLRRAIVEATGRPFSDRPITIQFNLSNADPNKDLEVTGTWTLPMNDPMTLSTISITDRRGQVTIDGATQPGGRATGPKIIIDSADDTFSVESTDNEFRNLSFKGGGSWMISGDRNEIANCWFGLSDDGNEIEFRTPGQENRLAFGGVDLSGDDNNFHDNVVVGAFGRAVDIESGTTGNIVADNWIGTRADGTVPAIPASIECDRSFVFDPQNWYGGWGIQVGGTANTVTGNVIAGLHILQSANDTPPMSLEVFGRDHTIANNFIGLDASDRFVGVCGGGIILAGGGTTVVGNIIVRSRDPFENAGGAILTSDSSPMFGPITLSGNLVAEGPDEYHEFGPGIPQGLRLFDPAVVTSLVAGVITGSSAPGSDCPNCTIEVFVDDRDELQEGLRYLGSATANGSGAWQLTPPARRGQEPFELGPNQGLRTTSTSNQTNVIGSEPAGTTSKLSDLQATLPEIIYDGFAASDLSSWSSTVD
jgi:hypothetical protein